MKRVRIKMALLGVGLAVSLLCAGCLEQDETITVAPNGDVTFEVSLSGAPSKLSDSILIPSPPEWKIVGRQIDSSGKTPELTIKAVANVPSGSPFPESFLPKTAKDYQLSLHFPGKLTIKKEGNRTFYTFERTYEARRFVAYDYSDVPSLWDHDLETKVLDSGLFNVSQQDRQKYLEQLSQGLEYRYWSYNRGALGELVQANLLNDSDMVRLTHAAEDYLDSTITPEFIQSVMQRSEAEIDNVLDSLGAAIDQRFLKSLVAVARGNSRIVEQYKSAYSREQRDYDITQKLDGFDYTINLIMPGTIVSTNGIVDSDHPGKVMWSFKGNKMHDANLPLHAVSVVNR